MEAGFKTVQKWSEFEALSLWLLLLLLPICTCSTLPVNCFNSWAWDQDIFWFVWGNTIFYFFLYRLFQLVCMVLEWSHCWLGSSLLCGPCRAPHGRPTCQSQEKGAGAHVCLQFDNHFNQIVKANMEHIILSSNYWPCYEAVRSLSEFPYKSECLVFDMLCDLNKSLHITSPTTCTDEHAVTIILYETYFGWKRCDVMSCVCLRVSLDVIPRALSILIL